MTHPSTSAACPECGATLLRHSSCTEHFHALLALEGEMPGGPGEVAHFYAVASYGVQHPAAMGYTLDTLLGLRAALADVISGRRDLDDVRRAVRYGARQAGRVSRQSGERVPEWSVSAWPVRVTDVLERGAAAYRASVERWARSIVETLQDREPAAHG